MKTKFVTSNSIVKVWLLRVTRMCGHKEIVMMDLESAKKLTETACKECQKVNDFRNWDKESAH